MLEEQVKRGHVKASQVSRNDLPPAVIVGLEANGLGVARSLDREGIPCVAVAGPWWNPCYETNACTVVRCSEWTAEGLVQSLITLGTTFDRKAPLLLTKDQAVLWVSRARDELSKFFEIALPPESTVDLLMSKVAFVELAMREGWPVPRTWMIESRDELLACASDVVYPVILKPQVKNDVFRRHSPQKAFRINSFQEFVRVYGIVSAWEKEVVVQEWIDGNDDRVGFCLGYCDRETRFLSLFPGRKLIQWPVGWGNTAVSEPAPEEWKEMISLTRRIWAKVGYWGLGSMEYKFRPGTNLPIIMEPTVGRTDFQSELAVLNGVNLPATAYRDLVGLPAPDIVPSSYGLKLVDGPSHLKAARVFLSSPALGGKRWIKARRGRKRYMIFRHGDYKPFLGSIYAGIRSMTGNMAEQLLGSRLKQRVVARLAK
jgi:predicted ATP-grasp superfamily ATP-dependent carboligase